MISTVPVVDQSGLVLPSNTLRRVVLPEEWRGKRERGRERKKKERQIHEHGRGDMRSDEGQAVSKKGIVFLQT